MNELLLLFGEELTPTLTPINYLKINTLNGIQTIPIYSLSDITDNNVRIYISGQIGCFELVDFNDINASCIKIYKDGVIKSLST